MMKKFNYNKNELLQRNQLKSVFGGNANGEEGDCEDDCTDNSGCEGEKVCSALNPKACPGPVNRCIYPA